ncbi:aromatic ring-hydroxylating dioxygenase subunit alpha [Microbulbifer sp. SSSA007]|uniref:aromatic ring-hydroxylating oxygenase subunit alpha n=1 Tax=Microbulbifer sp. SSSA007 TaxID=3243379 RepID=UPI004039E00D
MDRQTELDLIQRCWGLVQDKTTTLADETANADTRRYRSKEVFELEMEHIHRRWPWPLVHTSELIEANSLKAVETPLGSLIVSRDASGQWHAFHNSCRHRGATLLGEGECRQAKRIHCPYHAWSYTTDGALASVPGKQQCFPDLDKSDNGLLELPVKEKHGFIWLCPDGASAPDLDEALEGMSQPLAALQLDQLSVFAQHRKVWNTNWKIVAEGGIETYHFSYAHSESIGPYFYNNTAVIDALGPHLRVVMPTKALAAVVEKPVEQQSLRECSHTLYSLFPTSALLIQHQHIDWVQFRPLALDKTAIAVTTLVPTELRETMRDHWQRNHDITVAVLNEDFELGEGVQRSMNNGALERINYGRNEWALKRMNGFIDDLLTEK